jgi:hypothetical protein
MALLVGQHAMLMAQKSNGTTAKPTQEGKVKYLKFYPNPARDVITFEFINGYNRGYSFQIVSQIGNKYYDVQNVVSRFSINLNNYPRGVFFYILKDKFGKSMK